MNALALCAAALAGLGLGALLGFSMGAKHTSDDLLPWIREASQLIAALSDRCEKLSGAVRLAINHPQPVDVHCALHDALDPENVNAQDRSPK